jgi:hypothetical protein
VTDKPTVDRGANHELRKIGSIPACQASVKCTFCQRARSGSTGRPTAVLARKARALSTRSNILP